MSFSISIAAVAIFLSSLSSRGFISTPYSKPSGDEPVQTSVVVQPTDMLNRDGFEHFYNMEYDAAIHDFELALQAHPDEAFSVNHLLQTIFTRELYREGALNAELYFGNDFFHAQKVAVDPNARARMRELTARALALSAKRLKANANDVGALYDRGVTRAINAAYMGLVEKSWFAALRSGLGAYEDHEKVLRLSSGSTDAKFIVGLYSYAIGSLSWPERAAAFLLAFSGNKSKGREYVAQAAAGSGDTRVDAKAALALILARDHHYAESVSLMHGLYSSYPHNFLFAMMEADLLKASGHLPEAILAYRKLLDLGREGMFPGARLGLVAYKLGEALRVQENYAAALEAYGSVSDYPHAEPELVSKATLATGEIYDLLGQRSSAVKKYQELIAVRNDSPEAKTARQFLNHPYRFN